MASETLQRVITQCWSPLRWFAAEFLVIPLRPDMCSILTAMSRLVGCAVILCVLRATLSGGVLPGILPSAIQYVSSVLLAIAIANVACECALSLSARLMGLLRRDFSRKGVTLSGRRYRETLHPDGTWIRCESGPEGNVCEWTDTFGACTRIVTDPRRQRARR